MNPSAIPEKPLTAGINTKNVLINTVFFFEHADGNIIHVDEAAASRIFMKRMDAQYKYIGSSNGAAFNKGVIESREIFAKQGLAAAQERIRQGLREEIEEAKKDMRPPRNFERVDLSGHPVDLLGNRIYR